MNSEKCGASTGLSRNQSVATNASTKMKATQRRRFVLNPQSNPAAVITNKTGSTRRNHAGASGLQYSVPQPQITNAMRQRWLMADLHQLTSQCGRRVGSVLR